MKMDKRLLQMSGGIRKYIALTVGLGFLVAILTVLQASFLSHIIDDVFLGGKDLGQSAGWLIVLLAVIIGRAILNWGIEVSAGYAAGKAKTNLREKLFAKLFNLGPAYARGQRSGELSNTAVEGVEALNGYFSDYLPQLFLVMFVPTIVMLAVFSADFLSGIVLLVTAPILPLFMILVGKLAEAQTKKQWKAMSLLSAHFLDVLQGLTTLKLFGRSKLQEKTIQRISEQYGKVTMNVLKVAFLSALVLELGGTLSTAIIAVEIGLRLVYNQIPFQQAFFVLLLAPEFYMPFRALGARFHAAMSGGAAAGRIFEILEVSESVKEGNAEKGSYNFDKPLIRFEKVSFNYAENDKEGQPALQSVSFEVEPGQRVALVGPSGAGKSTIASLLLRFNQPNSGQITVNGVALENIPAREWRQAVAWVPQRPYLFHASVAENIGMGKPGATRAEIIEAARTAQVHDFIQTLPDGYETIIGERGARLSGGQAQRLGLARAFLKNAPLLILDEATSNLDP
ncbi:MAG TPA: thiol reductant ABC exporter subunit CydD, partial [Chloroflexia bacterium]|nr:thiol reductant ABC exporter subunit CydD [Chloroflexia bacterium]